MEEAKFSLNIKYRYEGFECQFTMRAEQGSASEQLDLGQKAVSWLLAHGAVPNGNHQLSMLGKAHSADSQRVCPVCGKDDELELIKFERDGKPRQAWKCQRCKKWLPGNGS